MGSKYFRDLVFFFLYIFYDFFKDTCKTTILNHVIKYKENFTYPNQTVKQRHNNNKIYKSNQINLLFQLLALEGQTEITHINSQEGKS